MKPVRVTLLLCLFLLAGTPTGAAPPATPPLIHGLPVTGRINDDNPQDTWLIDRKAGDPVNIEMVRTSGDLDPYLVLLDADGAKVTTDDDSGTGINSLISGLTLPADGPYTLVATRLSGGSGTYWLRLEMGPALPTEPGPGAEAGGPGGPVAVWDRTPITGNLDDEHFEDLWTFEGVTGEVVTFHMGTSSGSLDPYLELHDVDGEMLGWDDNGGGGTSAQLGPIVLPESGVYMLVAARFGAGEGTYSLTFSSEPPPDNDASSNEAGMLDYETVAFGTLSADKPADRWQFNGAAGDRVIIRMDAFSAALDPRLALLDPAGTEIASDDDSGEALNAWLYDFTLPTDGTYTIHCQNSGPPPDSVAPYQVQVYPFGTRGPGDDFTWEGPLSLRRGERNVGGLDATDWEDVWFFAGEWDEALRISLVPMSETLTGLYFELYAVGGDLVTLAYGSEGVSAPLEANVILPASGDYMLRVGMVDRVGGGYNLFVDTAGDPLETPAALDYGELVTGAITAADRQDRYTFTVNEQPAIVIQAARRSGDLRLLLELYSADGVALAYAADSEGSGLLELRDTLPGPGEYELRVTVDALSSGEYELKLLKQAPAPAENSSTESNGSAAAEPDAGRIAYGQTAQGTINDVHPVQFWDFAGHAGDDVSITLKRESGDLNGQIMLFDPDGDEVAYYQNWLGSDEWDAVALAGLPVTGTYAIAATRPDGDTSSGDYSLTLVHIPPAENSAPAAEAARRRYNAGLPKGFYCFGNL